MSAYPLANLPFSLGHGGNGREDTAAKRSTAVGLPQRVFLRLFASHRQRTATQAVFSTQARHKVNCPKGKRESPGGYPCRTTLEHVIPSGTCEFRCFAQFILADAVYSHQASELRNTVMLRLRRVANMCSSKVSDTANRRIHGAQSASMR